MRFLVSPLVAAIAISTSAYVVAADDANQSFVVSQVHIQGLKRLQAEQVYAQLPLAAGDTVDGASLNRAIKALYDTGQFRNIQASRAGSELTFYVTERPVIASINFEGNKLIPEEPLKQGLKGAGIAEGEVLNESVLAQLEKDLEQQYISQGRYNADVVIEQRAIPQNNAVALDFKFYEGDAAKVVDIKIIGNQYFSQDDIEDVFEVRSSSWMPFSKKDRYAQEKLAASLENLRTLYLNEGFVNFEVNNAVLNVSEDRSKVYIEISLSEGEQYQFGEVQFLGQPTYDDGELNKYNDIETGELFAQKTLTQTTDNLKRLYGNAGYYFAKIRPVPRIHDDTKVVDVDFFIDPGRPVYVRRINFVGNQKTADDVLRHELRQLEGALASDEKIKLSRTRLQRTGYFKTVKTDIKQVPNVPDKIDVTYTVEEQPSGSTTLAVGYSESGGLTFQAGLSQTNFLGTGNAVSIEASRSETVDSYNLSVTDPYFTVDGISQSFGVYYRETKTDSLNINNYLTDSLGARLSYGYPVDENKRVSAGIGIDQTTVKAGQSIAVSNLDYLLDNGGKIIQNYPSKSDDALTPPSSSNNNQRFEADFLTYNLNLGWSMDTRDQPVFPNKGMLHRANLEVAIPGSDAEYQKFTYSGNIYQPIYGGLVGRLYTKLGYGNDLPFYKNFYAGGYGSLRGYDNSSLGPRSEAYIFAQGKVDADGNRIVDPNPEYVGGNALVQFGGEVALPLPFKGDWTDQVRAVIFAEGAQVFDTTDRDQKTFDDTGIALITQDEEFRYTAGVSATWLTAIGPISLSYAFPLNEKKGDDTKNLQFEIGRIF